MLHLFAQVENVLRELFEDIGEVVVPVLIVSLVVDLVEAEGDALGRFFLLL